MSSFYTFYLIEKFGLSVQSAQIHLFVFLFASALGTLLGGPIGDRVGRKPVIWFSILGVSPFALLLQSTFANLRDTGALCCCTLFVLLCYCFTAHAKSA